MSKKKFGLNTNGWSKEFRSVFGSLEGYLGAAGFSTREIAKTPSDLFSIIFYAYGVKTDLKEPFSERIRQAQRRISLIPPKIRNKDQTRCRNKISIYGIDAFALEALKFVDQVSPVDLSDQKVAKAPKRKIPQKKKPQSNPYASFYRTWEWRTLRMQVLQKKGARCECCGATKGDVTIGGDGVKLVVDHIKPLRRNWELRLEPSNLQILCDECNMGKGSWDETDWRTPADN